jgi:ComF family protein
MPPLEVARSGLTAVMDSIRGLLELTLPGVCALCEAPLGEQRGPVCTLCWCRMDLLPHPQCQRCGHPLPAEDAAAHSPCRWCAVLPPYVRAVRSACWMQHGSGATRAVHALKYDGWRRVADGMATCMARLRWPADVVRERACLVPVPLTPWRERERGYNQAAELASALATHWHCPVRPVLRRTRMPVSQTRLTPGERQVNVTRAFTVASEGALHVKGAHCVLVDDVVTTAATLVACAAALMDSGARIVSCVTFGRAPAIGDRRSPLE